VNFYLSDVCSTFQRNVGKFLSGCMCHIPENSILLSHYHENLKSDLVRVVGVLAKIHTTQLLNASQEVLLHDSAGLHEC
jgi:hypothetical protein